MLHHRNISVINRLKIPLPRLTISGFLFAVLSFSILPLLSTLPVSALENPLEINTQSGWRAVYVTVSVDIPSNSAQGIYGPIPLTLTSTNTSSSPRKTSTGTYSVNGDSSNIGLTAMFASLESGVSYRVCVGNGENNNKSSDLCSDDFTQKADQDSRVTIKISKDKSAQYFTAASSASSCSIDGIGWIVCPVVNFLAKIADGAFKYLADNFLSTSPKIIDTSSKTYEAWAIMRSIANIAFVIAFLIIIFSQMTSVGITNYGIKKMLPRLIIAAILVNISFFICQIAVDLSNIIGYSLQSFLSGLAPVSSGSSGTWSGGTLWTNTAGVILAGAVGATVVWASLAALIPILLAATVALVMILFILVARQALIILLIVISPLAFVAFLLPNTDPWFKKWQKAFTSMLILFPVIALVLGTSRFASNILFEVFSKDDSQLGGIVAAAVLVLPLFVVPSLLKKSLDGVGSIGTKMSGWGDKLGGMAGKKGTEVYNNSAIGRGRVATKNYRQAYKDQRYADRLSKGGLTSRLAKGVRGNLGLTAADRFASQRLDSFATAAADKLDEEAVSSKATAIRGATGPGGVMEVAKGLRAAIASGDSIGARAHARVMLGSGGKGVEELHKVLAGDEAKGISPITETGQNRSIMQGMRGEILAKGVKASDAVLDKWATSGKLGNEAGTLGKKITDLATESGTFSGLSALEQAGQSEYNLKSANVSVEAANAVLSNPNATANMSTKKVQFYKDVVSGSRKPGDELREPPNNEQVLNNIRNGQ